MIKNKRIDVKRVWDFISSFFGFLDDQSKSIYEFFWEGIFLAALDMTNQAARFSLCENPESAATDPKLDFFDIKVDILKARPVYLDPTNYDSKYTLLPKRIIKTHPVQGGRYGIRNDLIEIEKTDYDLIEQILLSELHYVVISTDVSSVPIKYFKVKNLMGPVESGERYYPIYVIQTDGGNLDYIPSNAKLSIYFTDGKVYTVPKYVRHIPFLSTSTCGVDANDNQIGTLLNPIEHFIYRDGILEFKENLIEKGIVKNGDYLYSINVDVFEHNLYDKYGVLVSIPDWNLYNHDNITGKTAINTLVKSFQNCLDSGSYEKALNVYYGLPIAPDDAAVLGLYESYGYQVISVNDGDNWISVKLKTNESLHSFIQPGSRFLIDRSGEEVEIEFSDTESDVINRTSGNIKLLYKKGIKTGDVIYLRLPNRLKIKQVTKGVLSPSQFQVYHWTAGGDIDHLNNIIHGGAAKTGENRHPEFLVYGTNSPMYNLDGYYHITKCEKPEGVFMGLVNIDIDDFLAPDSNPVYNDFIDLTPETTLTIPVGYIHIPWPTHKFLFMKLSDGTLFKAYLDSAIDCIYDEGDRLAKYQPVARCVSILDGKIFHYWNQYDGFKKFNGLDINSHFLELTATIPYAKFGEYFPNSI